MRRLFLSMAAVPLLVGTLSVSASAEDGLNIFSDAKFNGEIRPRYEMADKEGGADTANALTSRISLGVSANLFEVEGLSTYLEGTAVTNFGYRDYNAKGTGINLNPKYDAIVDPQQARMTQAYLDYKINKTLIRAGRQDVNLDNQRFIGTVNWRQMKQTFDAVAVVDNSFENLSLLGAYVYGVIGVGEAQEATDTGSVLLNASYKVDEVLKVTAYGYMLASISDTYGLALTGKVDAGEAKLDYRAEYAVQVDPTLEYQTKNVKADAQYYNLDLGANISGILVGVNYEVLGKKNGSSLTGFTTPLATLHKFQGFADEFLADTNYYGLIDANVRVGYADKDFGKALLVYHDFSAQTGSAKDLGSEIDALYTNKVPLVNNLDFLLKAAFYQGGETGSGHEKDNTKYWVQLDYKF